jgi:hypothetical protein
VRRDGSGEGSYDLRKHIVGRVPPGDSAFQRVSDGDGRIKMSARNRAKGKDECYEGGARRERIRKQGDCGVSASELVGHDPRADNGCEQQSSSECFGS